MAGIKIKLAVDSSRNRVLFADAGSDFVDVLLSFLTLPLSAVQLCTDASSPGCLSSLRESVSQLSESKLLNSNAKANACHGMLLRPHAHELQSHLSEQVLRSECKCWMVMERVAYVYSQAATTRDVFVGMKRRFVISDDLVIKPASTESTLSVLQKMGSDRIGHGFEEVEVCVSWAEVVSMLKASISSQTVFTDTLLSKETDQATHVTNDRIIVDPKIRHRCDTGPGSSQHLNIKIFYDRCKKRVMYAEFKYDFVDLLLSFLTYPVGSLLKNLAGTSNL